MQQLLYECGKIVSLKSLNQDKIYSEKIYTVLLEDIGFIEESVDKVQWSMLDKV